MSWIVAFILERIRRSRSAPLLVQGTLILKPWTFSQLSGKGPDIKSVFFDCKCSYQKIFIVVDFQPTIGWMIIAQSEYISLIRKRFTNCYPNLFLFTQSCLVRVWAKKEKRPVSPDVIKIIPGTVWCWRCLCCKNFSKRTNKYNLASRSWTKNNFFLGTILEMDHCYCWYCWSCPTCS